jgi:hypothetical protein
MLVSYSITGGGWIIMLSNAREKVDVILLSFLFSIPHMSLLEGLFPNVGKNFL